MANCYPAHGDSLDRVDMNATRISLLQGMAVFGAISTASLEFLLVQSEEVVAGLAGMLLCGER